MARIAVDCDGVLARFEKAFFEKANSIWPGKCDPNYRPTAWDDFPPLTKAELNQVWAKIKATPNFWLSVDAYTDNVGALAQFLQTTTGHDIWIVTSRARTAGHTVAYQTLRWLYECGIRPGINYLGVVPVDDSTKKADVYSAMEIEFSVDDKTETVEQCDKLPNHTAFLLDREWNQDAKVKHRIPNLEAYFEHIKGTQSG